MNWLREQLGEESDRKFILASHVYFGARYNSFQLWSDEASEAYLQVLRDFKHRILLEVAGHDHFSSLRTHRESEDEYYHNLVMMGLRLAMISRCEKVCVGAYLFMAPSITAWYKNNPGVSSFQINDDLVPVSLRQTFLNLKPTIGRDEALPYEELEFRSLDYEAQYGLKGLLGIGEGRTGRRAGLTFVN